MKDNDLIGLVATNLEAASAEAGWNYGVLQKDQPTQQGIPYAPTIFFEKLFDRAYGHPMVTYAYNASPNSFSETEDQIVETTFQISALVIQEPTDLSIPTASDVIHYMRAYLTSRAVIHTMVKQEVAIQKVTELRNPYFQDERHNYEANPSFDIVYIHQRPYVHVVGATNKVVGKIIDGIAGQGTFPVPDNPYG